MGLKNGLRYQLNTRGQNIEADINTHKKHPAEDTGHYFES